MRKGIKTDEHKEEEREDALKQKLKCEFIRINPDREHFSIYTEISRIDDYIIETRRKKTKKILIGKI